MTALRPGITVIIPTITPRRVMLRRAINSVMTQRAPAAVLMVENDNGHTGSAATRNRALADVETQWVAFLDDDDELLPDHLLELTAGAAAHSADVVYSLPRVLDATGAEIPRRWDWGGPPVFDPALLRRRSYVNITSLVRTELAQFVGGFAFTTDETGASNDDHGFYLALLRAGAKFHHVPIVTWIWHHHGVGARGVPGNTSGMPDRW